MNYWMVKQEPEAYSFDDLLRDGRTDWTGVRNFQARNNLRAMRPGDKVLYYHTGKEKRIVGAAEVARGEFPDPTDGKWIAVEIKPLEKLSNPVGLEQIKTEKFLENIALIRQSRLSVMPLTETEFETIMKLGGRLPVVSGQKNI
ncbi:MAG TPA: EVE domain-containing protein [Pyrinomonadaceae bacterium]|jgi:predicted RNA-binding protein with PUA-like domain